MSDSLIAFQPSIEEHGRDHGEVLPLALGIGETQIDPLDFLVLDAVENVFCSCHRWSFDWPRTLPVRLG
jgi:hypothetical protein